MPSYTLLLTAHLVVFLSYCTHAYQEPPKILSLTPNELTIPVRGDAILECKVVSFPPAQIHWTKNGRRLGKSNPKFIIQKGPNVSYLRVTEASYTWQTGLNITCVAENHVGSAQASSILTTMIDEDREFQLVVLTNPKSIEPHTSFELECNVSSQVQPVLVTWYQSNQVVDLTKNKYRTSWSNINETFVRHILRIDGLPLASSRDSHEIEFMCGARTFRGTRFAKTMILLRNRLMPPVFLAPKRSSIEVEYGSSINVTCHANGMPRPQVKWRQGHFNDGSILDLSESEINKNTEHVPVKSELSGMSGDNLPSNIQMLHIHKLKKSLNFTCQAQNSFGLVVFNLSLIVKAKPDTPIGLHVATIYYNSIELEWKPGGYSDILYYNVKYRPYFRHSIDSEIYSFNYDQSNIETSYHLSDFSEDDKDHDDHFISINTTNTRFKVDNTLKPFHFYEFKVAALNGKGRSDDTNTIRVRTAATKPGRVKNIRYTCLGDSAYLIRCDEPEDPNGKLLSFRIYHTDRATNPLVNWQSIYVPFNEMPFKLNLYELTKRSKRYTHDMISRYDQFHFIRISAINAEQGEGPYSNIVELRNVEERFEAPFNFKTVKNDKIEKISSNSVRLKWSYDLEMLRSINKQLNIRQQPSAYFQKTPDNHVNEYLSKIDLDILKNVFFELYLVQKQVKFGDLPEDVSIHSLRRLVKPFRTIYAMDLLTANKTMRTLRDNDRISKKESIGFEYELVNLTPDTKYVFELSARLFHLEGHLTESLTVTTLPLPFAIKL